MKYIILFFRVVLGSVFLFTGFLKIYDNDTFFSFLVGIDFVPKTTIIILGKVFILAEILLGLLLLTRYYKKVVNNLVIVILSCFVMISFINVYYGFNFSCGCFGDLQYLYNYPVIHLIQNILLLLISIFIRRDKMEPMPWKNSRWIIFFTGLVFSLLLLFTNKSEMKNETKYSLDKYRYEVDSTLLKILQNDIESKDISLRKYGKDESVKLKDLLQLSKYNCVFLFTTKDCLSCVNEISVIKKVIHELSKNNIQIIEIARYSGNKELERYLDNTLLDTMIYYFNYEDENRYKLVETLTPIMLLIDNYFKINYHSLIATNTSEDRLFLSNIKKLINK